MSNKKLNRRQFLAGSALAGLAAAGLTGCSSNSAPKDVPEGSEGTLTPSSDSNGAGRWSWDTPPAPIEEDAVTSTVEKDVIVVGAGLAGVAAACSAAENGLSVAVIEKMPEPSFRGGAFGSVNNRYWKEAGVEVDMEAIARDWIAQSGSRCNEANVWNYLRRSAEGIEWFCDKLEANDFTIMLLACGYKGPTYPEYYGCLQFKDAEGQFGAGPAAGILLAESKDNGAEYFFECRAEQLEREGSKITGVIASTPEGYQRFVGTKGIVLATGDISGDEEMCQAFAPVMLQCSASQYTPVGANTGDGQKMALWAGAKVQDYAYSPMIHPQQYTALSNGNFLHVNMRGQRYMNEDTWCQGRSLNVLNQPESEGYCWAIFGGDRWLPDSIDTLEQGGGMFWDFHRHHYDDPPTGAEWWQGCIDSGKENGMVIEASSIEELASLTNLPADTLQATIDRYNELCAKGVDEDFGKRSIMLTPINGAPYYAAQFGPAAMVAIGGMEVNTRSQVWDTDDKLIENLYAIGNCAAGLYGTDYPLVVPGNSLGRCVTFGYLVGRELAGIE
ncbi:FAD-dependent oxidoreductase [Adlercreutzia sp. ZJ138]|uniref:FAD-dependent oxidoreductase n=1 Tax=Adlercreutzia sp. ZJ138 TaxID=2709405 RepID=UPI0013E9C2E8|nr:FAD-dependent oxidoreductase [Adlercreutzia sp. ZJ138]